MNYILFSANRNVTIKTLHTWNGIIEFSYDNKNWCVWEHQELSNNKIYLRGINNTYITQGRQWMLIGVNIKCQGNIENLLDYKTVMNNEHPIMKEKCFENMFKDCISLVEAPCLLATVLSKQCYYSMFRNCSSLTTVPDLPAKHLSYECYSFMFENCTSLINAPALSVTNTDYCCCSFMFAGCTALINPPSLVIPKLEEDCYYGMFFNCSALPITPNLPDIFTAKELLTTNETFYGCSSLTTVNINNSHYNINVFKLL